MTQGVTDNTVLKHRDAIIQEVQDKLGLTSKAKAAFAVKTVLESVVGLVAVNGTDADFRFALPELGIFKVKAVAQRNRSNPRDHSVKMVPAHTRVTFKLTKSLRDLGKPE